MHVSHLCKYKCTALLSSLQVAIKVTNKLAREDITIHWHGLSQRGSPWMDGVPDVSQCPITPGQMFTYRFVAEPAGTHWYHSHVTGQHPDGLYGKKAIS